MGITDKGLETTISDSYNDANITLGPFRTRIFRVSELIDMLSTKSLKLIDGKPFKIPSQPYKSRIIESLLLGLPPEPIIIDGADSPWFVADGAELLSTIYEYIHDQFKLDSVVFNVQYKGSIFTDLTLMLRSRLLNLQIPATIITSEATNIHRLGVYSTALIKAGKEGDLWKCTEAIYGTAFKELNKSANSLNVKSPQIILKIIIALSFARCFATGTFDKYPDFGRLRFDIFECLVLGSFNKDFQNAFILINENRKIITDVSNLTVQTKKAFRILAGKRLTLFIITVTLLSMRNKEFYQTDIIERFNKAWCESKGIGEGSLNEDYAKKASIIYNYLCR